MAVNLFPDLTDEQAMVVESSVALMDAKWPLSMVRRRADGGSGPPPEYRAGAAELGWFGLLAPAERGGGSVSGNGVVDAALIAAERGARLQPGPFVGHTVVVAVLAAASAAGGGSADHEKVLDDLVAGRSWATWAFAENPEVRLDAAGGDRRLSGRVRAVADAADCAWLLVTAASPDAAVPVLLAADAPGVTVRSVHGLDVSRAWCDIDLDGVAVAAADVVGPPDGAAGAAGAGPGADGAAGAGPGTASSVASGWSQPAAWQLAAVLSAADAVGAMHADFELAVQYAKDRIAFGRPIGSFQAIKHLLADTSLWLEMAKGLVADAAESLGRGDPGAGELAHAAKAFVSERGLELAHNCFQVFGGIGYTWEHDQHLYLRRIAADGASFGSAGWHRGHLLTEAGVPR